MEIHEHRIKLLLNQDEFSQFFKYHSEGRLQGSSVDLETDFESYFEGVGEEDLRVCFGAAADELCEQLVLLYLPNCSTDFIFDFVLKPTATV